VAHKIEQIMKKTILKAFILFCCLFSIQLKSQVSHLVISQVYGGGGNTGATYRNDFVELFNPTGSTISLNGMSIQYASAAGTFTTTASAMGTLSGNVPPGGYFLISLASGGANGILLPTADLSFTGINMSGTTGKVALVSNTTATTCGSLTNIDFVGFGTANCNEGGANAPAPSSTTADIRNNNGCVDTDNNGANFTASTPNPRNSGSTPLYCNPTKFVITSINPSSPTAGNGFNVTIVSQDAGNNPNNVLSNTSFSLSNIGGGSIGGITTGTITAGTNSVVVSGVTLSSAATGATITATRSSGDNLSPGISIPFNVLSSGGTPTKFVITSISPSSPLQGNAFDIIVESQDGNNVAQNVSSNTNFTLSTNGNAGALSGTVSGMINAGSSSVTLNGLILPNAGTGVTLMATFASGDNLSAGTSTSFTVLGVASQLAFVNVPSTGTSSTNISSFTIEARRPDNSVDVNYTGNITVSKASGPGLLIGTDIVAAVAGVATFNNLQFNQGGTYTLNATTGLLNAPVSGNIVISQASPTWNFGVGSGSAAPSAGTPFPNLSISDITQGNNNGTTVLTTTVSASSGYTGASGSFNAGAAARTGALNINTSGSAYFEFTLTPSNNKYVSITGIKFGSRSTGTGPQAYSLRSSKDAYASDLATGTLTANSNWSLNNPTVNANSSLVNTAVTFRLYGYNGTGSPGVGSANWRIDDVVLTLDVLDCSTPTAYNLIGGVATAQLEKVFLLVYQFTKRNFVSITN
jgi:hypothetical protein